MKNIVYKYNSKNGRILTGMKNGEEYIIFQNYINSFINESIIYDVKSKMDKEHYHNSIIVLNNANYINKDTEAFALDNGIEIAYLNGSSHSTSDIKNYSRNENKLEIYPDDVINQNNDIHQDDAIQDGTHASSIFSNFFGNKVERL